MTPEFWTAFRFALECAIPQGKNPQDHANSVIATQTKYTWADVHLVLFPVLLRYDLVVTSCSYLTREGEIALQTMRDGNLPVLKPPRTRTIDIRAEASRRTFEGEIENDFYEDPDGFTAFFETMLQLDLSSAYEGMEWYLWSQVYLILQGKPATCQDILTPLFQANPRTLQFLSTRMENEDAFDQWIYYANHVCPVV